MVTVTAGGVTQTVSPNNPDHGDQLNPLTFDSPTCPRARTRSSSRSPPTKATALTATRPRWSAWPPTTCAAGRLGYRRGTAPGRQRRAPFAVAPGFFPASAASTRHRPTVAPDSYPVAHHPTPPALMPFSGKPLPRAAPFTVIDSIARVDDQ